MEEARALGQIKEHFEITQEELADKVGKSRPAVTNSLRLLRLPQTVQTMLEDATLSAGHARALLGLTEDRDMEEMAATIVAKGLNVRATEEMIKKFKQRKSRGEKTATRKKPVAEDIARVLSGLNQRFTIKHSGSLKKGKIVLSYASSEERERIAAFLERMTGEEHA
jgi:ParB family chromosome partitioning protein